MKAKDHFIEWLREKILQNPQEPPAEAWQEISDGLDIEESWQAIGEELELDSIWDRIDTRLDRYNYILRFERLGYAFSTAVTLVFLFGSYFMTPTSSGELTSDGKKISESSPVAQLEEENESARSSSLASEASKLPKTSGIYNNTPAFGEKSPQEEAFPGGEAGEAKRASAILKQEINQEPRNELPRGTSKSYLFEAAGMEILNLHMAEEKLAIYFQEEENSIDHLYPSSYIGGGSAIKMSWLLSSKTLHALERSSLLTAAPAYKVDWFLLYGTKLKDRLYLQGDLYLQDVVGQKYNEYRNGQYGVVKDQLNYKSLSLTLSYVSKQIGGGSRPTYSRLLGGMYTGLLQSAEEISMAGSTDKSKEFGKLHLGLIGGYEYDTFLSKNFILSYGIKSRLDLLNIYSGTEIIPAAFRKTKAFSLDFSLSLKYVLK